MKSLVDDVLVAVPWADTGCPHRQAALGWVARQWATTPYRPPMLGCPDSPTWCKAEAVRNAIADQPGDILVIADADVWCDGVQDAIDRVHQGAPWARPHRLVHRLSPASTRQVLDGTPPQRGMELDPADPLTQLPGRRNQGYGGIDGGGIVAIRRDVYEDCPLDPRFRGWGHEDASWAQALTVLHGGPVRFGHDLWHLWHPPQERLSRGMGSGESAEFEQRYRRSRTPEAMRRLVDEAKEALCNR